VKRKPVLKENDKGGILKPISWSEFDCLQRDFTSIAKKQGTKKGGRTGLNDRKKKNGEIKETPRPPGNGKHNELKGERGKENASIAGKKFYDSLGEGGRRGLLRGKGNASHGRGTRGAKPS